MVVKIVSGKSIRGMLHYNENKVTEQQAALILASGFAADITGLSLTQKLHRFENLTMLNGRVKTNALHISLNFDAQDKLTDQQLQQLTAAYMERIGFGDQPYLVYKHTDAAHPHLHVATTTIKPDGNRIDIHGIGRTLSETARKALEKEYRLVQAEGRQFSNAIGIKAANIEKANYGKVPTKHTISNIVNAVTRTYKFTSVAELNAVLKQFNVLADRGKEHSMMFQKNGLIYSIINEQGEKVGVPIKASAIYDKPTLTNLEKKFEQNVEKRKPYKEPLKSTIEGVFLKYSAVTKTTFAAELAKQNVSTVFRQNDQGFIYGLTFIDNKSKTVFNGSDLGKNYSAKAITQRLSAEDILIRSEQKTYLKLPPQTTYLKKPSVQIHLKAPEPTNYLKGLLDKTITDYGNGISRRKKRKKKVQAPQQEQSYKP